MNQCINHIAGVIYNEMRLFLLLLVVLVLNLPFGYWRASVKRFSTRWFLAVHIPVPLVVAARILTGVGWGLSSLPLVLAAFFGGQFLGSAARGACRKRA
jgi:hypothetical protein